MGFFTSRCTIFSFTYLQKASNWYWHSNNLALLKKYFNHFKRVERFLFVWRAADNHKHVFNRLNWLTAKLQTTIITLNFFFQFWKNSMTNGTIPRSYQLAHKQYMSFFNSALLTQIGFMCMFGETRAARCSNGFEVTSGM